MLLVRVVQQAHVHHLPLPLTVLADRRHRERIQSDVSHRLAESLPVPHREREIPGLWCPDGPHGSVSQMLVFEPPAGPLGEDSARLLRHPQPSQLLEQLLGTTERLEDARQGDQRLHAGAVATIEPQGVVGGTVPGVTGVAVIVRAGDLGLSADGQDGAGSVLDEPGVVGAVGADSTGPVVPLFWSPSRAT